MILLLIIFANLRHVHFFKRTTRAYLMKAELFVRVYLAVNNSALSAIANAIRLSASERASLDKERFSDSLLPYCLTVRRNDLTAAIRAYHAGYRPR